MDNGQLSLFNVLWLGYNLPTHQNLVQEKNGAHNSKYVAYFMNSINQFGSNPLLSIELGADS